MAQRVEQIQRISKMIQEFDAQGWHRTGTTADQESAKWLVNMGQHLGVDLTLTLSFKPGGPARMLPGDR